MISYTSKYKCLACGKIFSKKQLEEKSLYSKEPLQDYLWEGRFGLEQRVVQHWKDTEYHSGNTVALQEDMCGETVLLDENMNPVKCFICTSSEALYKTKCGQSCPKCVLKAIKKEK